MKRFALPFFFLQAVEFGVQRIRDLARSAGRIDCVGRPVKNRAVLEHKAIPRGFVAAGASLRQFEILRVLHGPIIPLL